jgi:hypothetical protein
VLKYCHSCREKSKVNRQRKTKERRLEKDEIWEDQGTVYARYFFTSSVFAVETDFLTHFHF